MPFYTGIGARNTPQHILNEMKNISLAFMRKGYTLRSGGAEGADTAFFAPITNGNFNIYLPWDNFNGLNSFDGTHVNASKLHNFDKAKYIASMYHKKWSHLKDSHKTLHGRNAYQVLGVELDDPSDVLVCYAEPLTIETVKGGTNIAVQIAKAHGVPVYNLWFDRDLTEIKEILGIW